MPVDVLAQVLSALRITTTLFAMADLPQPWGIEFGARRGAWFHTLDGGEGWLHTDGGDPTPVCSGDVVLLAHGSAHRLTGSTDARVEVAFDPATWTPNALTGAPAAPGASGATLVCGAVDVDELGAHPLLALLPPVLVIGHDDPRSADIALTLHLLRRETHRPGPGTRTLLARLGDVLLIQLVRVWIDREDRTPGAPGNWLTALGDPRLGPALAALHADPGAPWTVDRLAAVAHLSRSRFAECFTAAVGQPPLAYLTRWRLVLAAQLLRDGRRVREVATAVGYTNEPAFSRAFSRHLGRPPGAFQGGGR